MVSCLTPGVPFVESTWIWFPRKAKQQDGPASLTITNDAFSGLARADAQLSKTKSKDWNYPSLAKKRENARDINKLDDEIAWQKNK